MSRLPVCCDCIGRFSATVFCAAGGDMASFLIVDFNDRENSPKVQYYVRIDGY
jgi:hypothetical protein